MSQPAAVRPASELAHAPSPPPQSVAVAIDAFIAATFARYEAVLATEVPALPEPRALDPRKALRLVAQVTETLAGFAVGAAIGAVAIAMKRSFGDATRTAIDAELVRIASHQGPTGMVGMPPRVARFFASSLVAQEKPLVDELGALLLMRLRQSAAEARRHVTAIARACPDMQKAFAMTVDLLTPDDATALAFTDQLATAWVHLRIKLGARASTLAVMPAGARFDRAHATWQAWSAATDGPIEPPLTPHDDVVAEGFLLQIR